MKISCNSEGGFFGWGFFLGGGCCQASGCPVRHAAFAE